MRWTKWLGLILAAGMLTACGGGGRAGGASQDSAQPSTAAPTAPGASPSPAPSADSAKPGSATGTPPPVQPGGNGAAVAVPPAERKIIYNAELNLKVDDTDLTIATLTSHITAAGGYVQESRTDGTRESGRTVVMTLRVPSGKYQSVLTLIKTLGEDSNPREWTQDVTAEFVDVQARVKTMENHVARLQELYTRAGTIPEMLELERELSRVTAELESLKGRLRVLTGLTDFSTITLRLLEPGAPQPIEEPANVWERATRGFVNSWNGVINTLGHLFVAAVTAVPTLLFLGVLGGGAFGIYTVVRRFRRPPSPPTSPE